MIDNFIVTRIHILVIEQKRNLAQTFIDVKQQNMQ